MTAGVYDAQIPNAVPPGFRQPLFDLVHAGQVPEAPSREFEPTARPIGNPVAQDERHRGKCKNGVTTVVREEPGKLRRGNRQLKLELEIRSRAAARFAHGNAAGKREHSAATQASRPAVVRRGRACGTDR